MWKRMKIRMKETSDEFPDKIWTTEANLTVDERTPKSWTQA